MLAPTIRDTEKKGHHSPKQGEIFVLCDHLEDLPFAEQTDRRVSAKTALKALERFWEPCILVGMITMAPNTRSETLKEKAPRYGP